MRVEAAHHLVDIGERQLASSASRCRERRSAAVTAEPVVAALVLQVRRRRADRDRHSAHRIDRLCRGAISRRATASPPTRIAAITSARIDTAISAGRLRSDRQPDRACARGPVRHRSRSRPSRIDGAAHPAGHQADVADAGVECGADRLGLGTAVAGDHHRGACRRGRRRRRAARRSPRAPHNCASASAIGVVPQIRTSGAGICGHEEDLQRPAGQARVDDDARARRLGEVHVAVGQHPQQHALAASAAHPVAALRTEFCAH